MARAPKVIYFIGLMIGSAWAQVHSGSAAGEAQIAPRLAIFQKSVPVVAVTATISKAQLSQASYRLASDNELDGMERTLGGYVTAFESLNLAGVKQVWPDLDRQHANAFKDLFAGFKGASASPHLLLQCAAPRLSADTANADCRETISYQTGKGKGKTKELGPVGVLIQLKGESGHWVVADMKGSN